MTDDAIKKEGEIESKLLKQKYYMKFSDGSVRALPVTTIMMHHAMTHDPDEMMKYLEEETVPLFESNPDEISDWAKNNMDWAEVESETVLITPPTLNYQREWIDAEVIIK